MRALMRSLCTALPCKKCRTHLADLYEKGYEIDCSTRASFREGLFKLHNKVSEDIGKPKYESIPSLDRGYYEISAVPVPHKSDPFWLGIGVAIVVLVTAVLVWTILGRNTNKKSVSNTK